MTFEHLSACSRGLSRRFPNGNQPLKPSFTDLKKQAPALDIFLFSVKIDTSKTEMTRHIHG